MQILGHIGETGPETEYKRIDYKMQTYHVSFWLASDNKNAKFSAGIAILR